ncbi:MAG: phasin family protein [Burkholderiaceae bacterium]
MLLTPEQILAAHKANLETLMGFTQQAVAGVEHLIQLNLAVTKAAIEDSHKNTQMVMGAKDSQDLVAMQSTLFQPLAEKMMSYNRQLFEIVSNHGGTVSQGVEQKYAQAQHAFQTMVDNVAKNAPAGSEPAVNAFKTALAAGNQAMESVQNAVKQATELAQSNYQKATDSVIQSGKNKSKKS